MTSRESHRIKDAEKKRVLDEAARRRRARKAIEALEQDNFHDDPHADLVMSKKVPKFQDSNDGPTRAKKAKKRNNEFIRAKYRKNLGQLLEEAKLCTEEPNYFSALAPPPTEPDRHFCAVCGNFSCYTCTSCGNRYCCLRCLKTHQDTRCLKWTA